VPEMLKFKVPNSFKNRDKEQKQKMKYFADKRMSNDFQKYRIGQNVILLRREESKMSG
jgi:hypothetical protein